MRKEIEKKLYILITLYFIIGLVFAFAYAIFYHWPALSFLSPGFWSVIFTWPFQAPGFFLDFQTYGFSGKPT
jgi:hypothetical protein